MKVHAASDFVWFLAALLSVASQRGDTVIQLTMLLLIALSWLVDVSGWRARQWPSQRAGSRLSTSDDSLFAALVATPTLVLSLDELVLVGAAGQGDAAAFSAWLVLLSSLLQPLLGLFFPVEGTRSPIPMATSRSFAPLLCTVPISLVLVRMSFIGFSRRQAMVAAVALCAQQAALRMCARSRHSFSLVEGTVVSQLSMLLLSRFLVLTWRSSACSNDPFSVLACGLGIGVATLIACLTSELQDTRDIHDDGGQNKARNRPKGRSASGPMRQVASPITLYRFLALIGIGVALSTLWMQRALCGINPWIWLFSLLHTNFTIQTLVIYFILCLTVGLSLLGLGAPRLREILPAVVIRKLYHALALALFIPATLFHVRFMGLAYGLALEVFILLECMRYARLPPIGPALESFMRTFADTRDGGSLILTHMYMLFGCALPTWLTMAGDQSVGSAGGNSADAFHLPPLTPFMGLLSVGLADAAASVFGTYHGRTRWPWPPGSKKTLEGSAAAALSMLLVGVSLSFVIDTDDDATHLNPHHFHFQSLFVASAFAAALEGLTQQIDNLLLPIVTVSTLAASHRVLLNS